MCGVGTAALAVLVQLNTVRIIALVFDRRVIAFFTRRALQGDDGGGAFGGHRKLLPKTNKT
jgi:hypothetical protein